MINCGDINYSDTNIRRMEIAEIVAKSYEDVAVPTYKLQTKNDIGAMLRFFLTFHQKHPCPIIAVVRQTYPFSDNTYQWRPDLKTQILKVGHKATY